MDISTGESIITIYSHNCVLRLIRIVYIELYGTARLSPRYDYDEQDVLDTSWVTTRGDGPLAL